MAYIPAQMTAVDPGVSIRHAALESNAGDANASDPDRRVLIDCARDKSLRLVFPRHKYVCSNQLREAEGR
jgi:hypothetical protein